MQEPPRPLKTPLRRHNHWKKDPESQLQVSHRKKLANNLKSQLNRNRCRHPSRLKNPIG